MLLLVLVALGATWRAGPWQAALNASTCGETGGARPWGSAWERLSRGQPITILAIGSSLVGVQGGCTAPAPVLASATCASLCPRCCGSRCGHWGDTGWARELFEWMNTTYPVSRAGAAAAAVEIAAMGGRVEAGGGGLHSGDRTQHQLFNLGEPGGNVIPAIIACPQTYIGFDAHLILVDLHSSNMRKESSLRDTERLVRMMLASPSRPALLLVEFSQITVKAPLPLPAEVVALIGKGQVISIQESKRLVVMQRQHEKRSVPLIEWVADLQGWGNSREARERAVAALLQGTRGMLPLLKGKDARASGGGDFKASLQNFDSTHRLQNRYNLALFSVIGCLTLPLSEGSPFDTSRYSGDGKHPSSEGSRLIGAGLIELVRKGLAAASAQAALNGGAPLPPIGNAARSAAAAAAKSMLPPPLTLQPQFVGIACYTFDRAGYEAAVRVQNRLIGGPVIRSQSIMEDSTLPGTPPAILSGTHGWSFVEREKSRTSFKPGLVADLPGAQLQLAVDISAASTPFISLQA